MNIKSTTAILAGMMFAACSPAARCADAPAEIKLTIEFHMEGSRNPPPPFKLDNHDAEAYFIVVIENISDKPLLLSYGTTYTTYLEVTDEHGITTKVGGEAPPPAKKAAMPISLKPKQTTMLKIHYVGRSNVYQSYALDFPPAGKSRQVTIRAIMEGYGPADEAGVKRLKDKGYWVGKVESEAYKVTLVGAAQTDKP